MLPGGDARIRPRAAREDRIQDFLEVAPAVRARVAIETAARAVRDGLGERRRFWCEHWRAAELRFDRVEAERFLLRQPCHEVVELPIDRGDVRLKAPEARAPAQRGE